MRAESASQPGGTSDSETGYQNSDSCPGSESQEGEEQVALVRRDSTSSTASAASTHLEQKIEEKLKFSQFLNEVTCRVLNPECLQAFGAHVRQKEPLATSSLQCLNQTPVSSSLSSSPWFASSRDSLCDSRDSSVHKWAKCMPSCKILDASKTLRRTQEGSGALGRTYLETDIDQVRREDEVSSSHPRDVENRTVHLSGEPSHRRQSSVSKHSDGAPRPPYRSTSLPRPAACNIPVSPGEIPPETLLKQGFLFNGSALRLRKSDVSCSSSFFSSLTLLLIAVCLCWNLFKSLCSRATKHCRRANERPERIKSFLSSVRAVCVSGSKVNN